MLITKPSTALNRCPFIDQDWLPCKIPRLERVILIPLKQFTLQKGRVVSLKEIQGYWANKHVYCNWIANFSINKSVQSPPPRLPQKITCFPKISDTLVESQNLRKYSHTGFQWRLQDDTWKCFVNFKSCCKIIIFFKCHALVYNMYVRI